MATSRAWSRPRTWTTAWAASEPAAAVPAGFSAANAGLNQYTSVYWDAAAWAAAPGDVTAAVRTRWLLWGWTPYATPRSVPVPHTVMRPGGTRMW